MFELYVQARDSAMMLRFADGYKAERMFMDLRVCPEVMALCLTKPGETTVLSWTR